MRRLEDRRHLTGAASFVDDVDLPGQWWMRIVRSPLALGRIKGIDADDARSIPGVEAVITAADLPSQKIPIRSIFHAELLTEHLQPVLAEQEVRYVGQPVAVVLARNPYVAEDAAEIVFLDLEMSDPLVDATAPDGGDGAYQPSGNVADTIDVGYGDVAGAFSRATHVVSGRYTVGRHGGVPMETRGLVATVSGPMRRLSVWGGTKVPNFNRRRLATYLGIPDEQIQFQQTDAGGGFGARGELYPEDYLVAWCAWHFGVPIKWIEDRTEHLMATNQSREQHHYAQVALDGDGHILALRDEFIHDNGAYVRTHGVQVAHLTSVMMPGCYNIPAYASRAHVVLTNKTPCGTMRSPGRYESTFVREMLFEKAAAMLELDPIEFRERNLLRIDEMPTERIYVGTDVTMDLEPVDYRLPLRRVLMQVEHDAWDARVDQHTARGFLAAWSASPFLEKSGGPFDTASVRIEESGRVTIIAGGTSLGQGIQTAMATIASRELGVDISDISVVVGDTDQSPFGEGSFASRSTVLSGSAVMLASRDLAARVRLTAAEILEAAEGDLELVDGAVSVVGNSSVGVRLSDIARLCRPGAQFANTTDPGLTATRTFELEHETYEHGAQAALVVVDPETGQIKVDRYIVAADVGKAVDRNLVRGQLLGGVVQGLGGCLLENFAYDENGQPSSTSFMDYLLPTAHEAPPIRAIVLEDFPSARNPLGAKGAGEAGITGVAAVVACAASQAIGAPGIDCALPLTPERVLHLSNCRRYDATHASVGSGPAAP
jgi:Aerobic-type carbon monoxide dehydrogenase, large subunit CoxL/CutL homologs